MTAPGSRRAIAGVLLAFALLAAACGDSGDRASGGGDLVRLEATLGGEAYESVRAVPAAALAADDLAPAGEATAADGSRLAFGRAQAGGLEPWELASASDEGWRIWRPGAVAAVERVAGGKARRRPRRARAVA